MKKIKDLKKGDVFIFNDIIYRVLKKYVNDDHPLIAWDEKNIMTQLFHNEDLDIISIC